MRGRGLGGVRLRGGRLLDPAQAEARVRAHGDGSPALGGEGGDGELGQGFWVAVGMGPAEVGANGRGGGLSGSLPPAAASGGFRLSSASSCGVAGLACAGLPSRPAARPCSETNAPVAASSIRTVGAIPGSLLIS